MDNKNFKNKYQKIKDVLEEVDPTGWGAKDEYDDLIFRVMKEGFGVKTPHLFSENLADIISSQFGLEKKSILKSCDEVAKKVFSYYPDGI